MKIEAFGSIVGTWLLDRHFCLLLSRITIKYRHQLIGF